MLQRCRFDAILPATNLERARRWYAEKLGLDQPREAPEGLYYECAKAAPIPDDAPRDERSSHGVGLFVSMHVVHHFPSPACHADEPERRGEQLGVGPW